MATISADILASYAADAALETPGVADLVESTLPRHKGVRVLEEEGGGVRVELQLEVEWGVSIPDLGREVQRRVVAYLGQMASIAPDGVDVVVTRIGSPPKPA